MKPEIQFPGRSVSLSLRAAQRARTLRTAVILYLIGTVAIGLLALSLLSGRVVIGGVPTYIILQFMQDDIARTAYLNGDVQRLHDRLDQMGIEEQIKAFYRPQFSDEAELDRYIHQVLFDLTGYVGKDYRVLPSGNLVLKTS